MNKQDVLKTLNEEQKIPVQNYKGPQFLVAGPGSGKTRVLIAKTQYMILDGVNPRNILLFTFTNKAAKEIKDRIKNALSEQVANQITIGTYHGFCFRLLKQYTAALDYKSGWNIIDAEDSDKILKSILKKHDIDIKIVKSFISQQKHKVYTVDRCKSLNLDAEMIEYYEQYQKELKKNNVMDFDDLILNTILLLESNPDILEKVNKRYRYISADESHDSSKSDVRLISLLAGYEQNVCFILDDDQSIYSFRGASMQSVLNIRKHFNNLKIYYLNQNYRSTKNIVAASKSVIANNPHPLEKQLFTNNVEGSKVIVMKESTSNKEAVKVANMILLLTSKYHYKKSDIAILYRTSAQSRVFEEVFLKYKIPYEILSGINFYARKEVKDIVAFIRFICNPYDREAFERIINLPKRGIGFKTIEKIYKVNDAAMNQETLLDSCVNAIANKDIKGKAAESIKSFVDNINKLSAMQDKTTEEIISAIIKSTNYYKYLEETEPEAYDDKVSNVIELVELASQFPTLEDFLEQFSFNREDENGEEVDKVQLLTMHMSKGLEWKNVFIVGAIEGSNPHFKAKTPVSIQEERRLFYVAMTRAQENLFISYPCKKIARGYLRPTIVSRFINEINKDYAVFC